jgi:peptide/nickel transport system substrate-binding protein
MIPMLNAIGINAKLRTPEWATLWADVQRGKTPFYYMGRGSVVDPGSRCRSISRRAAPRASHIRPGYRQDARRRAGGLRPGRAQEGAQRRVQGDRGCGAGVLHVAASHALWRSKNIDHEPTPSGRVFGTEIVVKQ